MAVRDPVSHSYYGLRIQRPRSRQRSVRIREQGSERNPRPASASERKRRRYSPVAASGAWSLPFEKLPGVYSVVPGYSGGSAENADYKKVSAGLTRHAEVIEIAYDPQVVSYDKLLEVFWKNIDPIAVDRQFCDRGKQYRSAIFYSGEKQEAAARKSFANIAESKDFLHRLPRSWFHWRSSTKQRPTIRITTKRILKITSDTEKDVGVMIGWKSFGASAVWFASDKCHKHLQQAERSQKVLSEKNFKKLLNLCAHVMAR